MAMLEALVDHQAEVMTAMNPDEQRLGWIREDECIDSAQVKTWLGLMRYRDVRQIIRSISSSTTIPRRRNRAKRVASKRNRELGQVKLRVQM